MAKLNFQRKSCRKLKKNLWTFILKLKYFTAGIRIDSETKINIRPYKNRPIFLTQIPQNYVSSLKANAWETIPNNSQAVGIRNFKRYNLSYSKSASFWAFCKHLSSSEFCLRTYMKIFVFCVRICKLL